MFDLLRRFGATSAAACGRARKTARRGGASGLAQLLDFAAHQLEMNVQGVERVADLVRHAGRQERQGMKPLALDGLKGLLPRFGGVVQNQRHARTAARLSVQRRGVKAQEPRARIRDFKLVTRDARPAFGRAGRVMLCQSSSGRKSVIGRPSTSSGGQLSNCVTAWLK